ncbi:MAG: hypothetical protein H8E55_06090, partial [Pelagibacterales bacterium]|nr:hypothetical protein [Pelagibacterales bacterium]
MSLGITFIFGMDDYECEDLDLYDCSFVEYCIWSDEDGDCIPVEDDDSEDDDDYEEGENYQFRAHAELTIGSDDTDDEVHFGKVKTKIDSQSVNSLEFDLKNLAINTDYYIQFNNFWSYDFTTNNLGKFDWTLSSDLLGDNLLPSELIPVTSLTSLSLFEATGVLVVSAEFELDDDACDDLPQTICEAIPLCTWDSDNECEENEWDLDDDEEVWEEGEYYSEDIFDLYAEYMGYYNSTGDGIFNFITIDATNNNTRADIGDEIGLLDYQGSIGGEGTCDEVFGETITAAGVWDGSPITLFAFGNLDNCAENGFLLPGFVSGNPIIMRVWKPALEIYFDIELGINWGNNQTMSTV